jgi:dUTP pyrophosphatase
MKDRSRAQPLQKQTSGSAGFDLANGTAERIPIHPGKHAVIRTGIKIQLPDGYEMQIRSRSGLAAKNGVMVLNSPGTIDSDYQGEVCVILYNAGGDLFWVEPGARIAQAVVNKLPDVALVEAVTMDIFNYESERGEGGFGSTGS